MFSCFVMARGIKGLIHIEFGRTGFTYLFLGALASVLILIYLFRRSLKKGASNFLLFFFPFACITIGRLAIDLFAMTHPLQLPDQPIASSGKPRIFWLIFDELDQNLLFDLRPAEHHFPEFDSFQQQSIYCSKALQPGTCTTESLPAWIVGKKLKKVFLAGPRDLYLLDETGKRYNWRKTPSIFQKANALGYHSAFIGWYQPYDRIIAQDTHFFSQEPFLENEDMRIPFAKVFANLGMMFLKFNFEKPLQKFLHLDLFQNCGWPTAEKIERDEIWYSSLCQQIQEVVDNPSLDFAFFHLSVPHYPTIYDPQTGAIGKKETAYYDNVYLADKLLGFIRSKLEQSQQWDASTIIVTSDHWLRTQKGFVDAYLEQESDEFQKLVEKRTECYVPLLIKLQNQQQIIHYKDSIDAIFIHDLVLNLMEPVDNFNVVGFFDETCKAFVQ